MKIFWLMLICLTDLCLIQNVDAAVIITRDGRRFFVDSYKERGGTTWFDSNMGGTIGQMGVGTNQIEKIIQDEDEIAPGNTIIVFGRLTDEWTVKYLTEFKSRGIKNIIYKNIDNKKVSEEIAATMKSTGLKTDYDLPVIEVNKKVFIRPDINNVIEAYNNTSNPPAKNDPEQAKTESEQSQTEPVEAGKSP